MLFSCRQLYSLLLVSCLLFTSCQKTKPQYDVIVLGEGTGAVAAAIQSARSGARTLLVNPLPWLGGMLTSAGVPATDGNHQLHAGLWNEWRALIRQHYGGIDSVFTGWVSNTMFEPSIGDRFWKQLADKEENLTIRYTTNWGKINYEKTWQVFVDDELITAKVLVDGTDLGDVAAAVGVDYALGTDARSLTQESIALTESTEILQDLTYSAILKDYNGPGAHTLERPVNYDPNLFRCACKSLCPEGQHDCETMLNYGKLPNNKYMINWPIHGNDYYTNIVNLSFAERQRELEKAKQHTLNFIYFIQHDLGYVNLGLANDEFPTEDQLPLIPYHREGRRIQGLTLLTLNEIADPYAHGLYKTGVAVGDYPIDHHHDKHPDPPAFDFPTIPSFSIPFGSLISKDVDHLVIADKAISVSNIANGSTRLQPVILQVGQAAGLIAAMSAKEDVSPRDLAIRHVQESILDYNGYLMPYIDVSPTDPDFKAMQRIGASGILKGRPVPYKWANQTWFDPDSLVQTVELLSSLSMFDSSYTDLDSNEFGDKYLTLNQLSYIINFSCQHFNVDCEWPEYYSKDNAQVTRREFAKVFDEMINPFRKKAIRFDGEEINMNQ
jgi:hypothetical protein